MRLLAPVAWAAGGYASAEARVITREGAIRRPAVLVALGEPPHDGVLAGPPLLAVELDPRADAAAWLALGAAEVWLPAPAGARRCLPDGTSVLAPPGAWLALPGRPEPALRAGELSVPEEAATLRFVRNVR